MRLTIPSVLVVVIGSHIQRIFLLAVIGRCHTTDDAIRSVIFLFVIVVVVVIVVTKQFRFGETVVFLFRWQSVVGFAGVASLAV